jgi:hypothetical protein
MKESTVKEIVGAFPSMYNNQPEEKKMSDDVFNISVEKEVTYKITAGDIEAEYLSASGEINLKMVGTDWFEMDRASVSQLFVALQEIQKIIDEEKTK